MIPREPTVAAHAADWLESIGLDVYQEVVVDGVGRADLVGAGAQALIVVEVKVELGLDVLAQAGRWGMYANATWIAVPAGAATQVRRFGKRVCREFGIGMLSVAPGTDPSTWVSVPATVRPTTLAHDLVRDSLRPEQRRGAGFAPAGSQGGHYTPFRSLMREVGAVVSEYPAGIKVADLVEELKRRGVDGVPHGLTLQLPRYVKRGLVPGVRLDKCFGRKATTLRPTPAGAEADRARGAERE